MFSVTLRGTGARESGLRGERRTNGLYGCTEHFDNALFAYLCLSDWACARWVHELLIGRFEKKLAVEKLNLKENKERKNHFIKMRAGKHHLGHTQRIPLFASHKKRL